jgi:hypothetical protein
MAAQEIHIELLLGRRVRGVSGRWVGRIEEICAEQDNGELVVREFHLGSYALFERLSASIIGRLLLRWLGPDRRIRGRRVPWDKLDLSDPEKPALLCPVNDLQPLS